MALYLRYVLMHLRCEMQYKASFALLTAGNFAMQFATFLSVFFLFQRFDEVGGFTYGQVLLCFAVVFMAFSFAEMFARGLNQLPHMLGNGEFDRALVRPKGALFQVIASRVHFVRLGATVQSFVVLCWAISGSGVVWTWDRMATLCLMVVGGSVVFFALFLIQAAFAFYTTEGLEFMNVLTYGGRDHGRYPFSIYGRGVLRFVTYVVPLALFQYYPLLYLLGRESGAAYMLAPLAGMLFVAPAYAFFRHGVRRYRSTGS